MMRHIKMLRAMFGANKIMKEFIEMSKPDDVRRDDKINNILKSPWYKTIYYKLINAWRRTK